MPSQIYAVMITGWFNVCRERVEKGVSCVLKQVDFNVHLDDIRIFRDQQFEFAYVQSLNTLDALLYLVSVSQEDGGDNV